MQFLCDGHKVNMTLSWTEINFSRGLVCICKARLTLSTVHSCSSQEAYDTIVGQTKITFLLQAIRDVSAAEEVCTFISDVSVGPLTHIDNASTLRKVPHKRHLKNVVQPLHGA